MDVSALGVVCLALLSVVLADDDDADALMRRKQG